MPTNKQTKITKEENSKAAQTVTQTQQIKQTNIQNINKRTNKNNQNLTKNNHKTKTMDTNTKQKR